MVTGSPNTLGSFGELPDDHTHATWKIEFSIQYKEADLTLLHICEQDIPLELVGDDDNGFWYAGELDGDDNLDDASREYEDFKSKLHAINAKLETDLFSPYSPEP